MAVSFVAPRCLHRSAYGLAVAGLLGIAGSLVLSGCARSVGDTAAQAAPLPLHSSRALSPSAPVSATNPASALPSVWAQQQPLYRQAASACKSQQYGKAADLLAQLAVQPGLTSAQIAFVQEQRILCLRDAHLPVPSSPVASAVSLSAAALPRPVAPGTSAEADCGPRALLLLCRHEGIVADLPHLRMLAGTTREGTSLAGLAKAAKAIGLQTEGVQVSREALADAPMPALAYVNGDHFIAVLSVQGRGEDATATVHDPNSAAEETIPQERLLRLCSGYLLLAHR